jgi:Zn-dependent peptidase ImmA (M78 family)
MEWEANRFSAHLLLPTKLVTRAFQQVRGFDLTHLLALARDFDTSKEFTALHSLRRRAMLLHHVV